MFGTSGSLRFCLCAVVFVCVISTCTVNGYFFDSITGLAADIMRKPLESFSLFALKSYLLGHVGGRVSQYRQMMYQAQNRPPYYGGGAINQYMPSMPRSRSRRSLLVNEELQEKINAVQKKQQQPLNSESIEASISAQFLEMAEKLDADKCIPRLICDVMSGNGVTQGGHFEELVVRVLGDEVPEKKDGQNLFPSIYHYAAYAGKRVTSGDACRELFPKCKASELEFRKMADKIFSSVDDVEDELEELNDQSDDGEVVQSEEDQVDRVFGEQ